MSRCGCGSTGATGAAMTSSACLEVSGAGTPLSPFMVSPVIDGQDDNLIECGAAGLYARTPVQAAGDASMNVVEQAGQGDYEYSVAIADGDDIAGWNVLGLFANGIGVDSWESDGVRAINMGLYGIDDTLTSPFPGAVETLFGLTVAGTTTVALNSSGDGNITLPGVFPNALISVIAMNGDASLPPFSVALNSVFTVGAFSFHCEPIDPARPVASTNVRITYIALGC